MYSELFFKSPLKDPSATTLLLENRHKTNCNPRSSRSAVRPRLQKPLFQEAIHPTTSTHARRETRGSGETHQCERHSRRTASGEQGLRPSEPPAPAPPFTLGEHALPTASGTASFYSAGSHRMWATSARAAISGGASL